MPDSRDKPADELPTDPIPVVRSDVRDSSPSPVDERHAQRRFATDEERALIGAEHRRRTPAPIHGVPVFTASEDDFTPITDVLALAETEHERELLTQVMHKFRNSEMRQQRRVEQTEGGQLRHDLDETTQRLDEHLADVREAIADIHGKSGQNGKLGELRRVVADMRSRMWWAFTAFVGMIAGAAVKLVIVVRAFDAVDARSVANEKAIAALVDENKILQAQVMTLQAAAISRRSHRSEPGPTLEPRAEAGSDSP